MTCDCRKDESCPKCCCEIELKKQECPVKNLECVIKVADHVQKTVIGSLKLYVINLIVKNCTKQVLTNFSISLDLKCALIDFPSVKSCDPVGSPITDSSCVGVMTLDAGNACNLLQGLCIEAAPYRVNAAYDGITQTSLLDPIANGNVRIPPGETCITVRFFTPNTASLISPCVTISICVPCCGPLRKVVMLKADCAPTILDKTCACWVGCDNLPQ